MDPIREAIQKILDIHGDGWSSSHYVVAIGLERVTEDGNLETSSWWYAPPTQADYITDGLLGKVCEMRAEVTEGGD